MYLACLITFCLASRQFCNGTPGDMASQSLSKVLKQIAPEYCDLFHQQMIPLVDMKTI